MFHHVVGGGGGHKLWIRDFAATFYPFIPSPPGEMPEVEACRSVTDSHNDGLYGKVFCAQYAPFDSFLSLSFRYRDQGWGSRKSRVRIEFGGVIQWSSAVAQHFWETIAVDLTSLGAIPTGTPVKFLRVVGSGGDHRIYVRDFQATWTPAPAPGSCRCKGGNSYGSICTSEDHNVEWCYLDAYTSQSCPDADKTYGSGTPGGWWSEKPCAKTYSALLPRHECPEGKQILSATECADAASKISTLVSSFSTCCQSVINERFGCTYDIDNGFAFFNVKDESTVFASKANRRSICRDF